MTDLPTEGNDELFGTEFDDVINALGGDDFIEGSAGADTYDGGEGIDTLSYENFEGAVNVSNLSGFGGLAAGDTVANIEVVRATNFDDNIKIFSDQSGATTFFGLLGDDNISLAGSNSPLLNAIEIFGGAGDDTMSLQARLDGSEEEPSEAFAQSVFDGGAGVDSIVLGLGEIDFSVTTLRNFEELSFTGNSGSVDVTFLASQVEQFSFIETNRRDSIEISILMEDETELDLSDLSTNGGNGSANDFFIFGDADAEVIVGTNRADVIDGGGRSDDISGGNGNDTLIGGNGADTLNGDDGDDNLTGNIGNDTINGGTGADTLQGGNNRDTLNGGADNDIVRGNNGVDVLFGDAGNDRLEGGAGNDTLDGGEGDDRLIGGLGKDTLTGGEGADEFEFRSAEESPNNTSSDVITDFEVGVDFIDLAAITDGITFIGTDSFSGTGAEVRFKASGDTTTVRVDVDGDGNADLKIVVQDVTVLTEADFIL